MFSKTSTKMQTHKLRKQYCNKVFSKHLDSVQLIQRAENVFICGAVCTKHSLKP